MRRPPALTPRVCLVFALAVAGALLWVSLRFEKYVPIGADLVTDGSFESAESLRAAWSVAGDGSEWSDAGADGTGGVRLERRSSSPARVYQHITPPSGGGFLLARARMRTANVTTAEQRWQDARVILVFRNGRGEPLWRLPHVVCGRHGTHAWKTYEHVFAVPPSAQDTRIEAQQLGAAGTAWVDDMAVVPVRLRPAYFPVRDFLGLAWFAVLGLGFLSLPLRRSGWGLMAILCALAITAAAVCPTGIIDTMVDGLQQTWTRLQTSGVPAPEASADTSVVKAPVPPAFSIYEGRGPIRALGHFAAFLCLALFCRMAVRAYLRGWLWAPLGATVFASGTELLQTLTLSRSPRLHDWGLNMTGLLVGLLAAWLLGRLNTQYRTRNIQ